MNRRQRKQRLYYKMKTIGFVDYYVSEWHANKYPGWIKEINESLGSDFAVGYCWAEEYVSHTDGRNTDEWCSEFGVERCQTLAELCEKADYILVLAPSDPEKHLAYAQEVLKYGKNTYIDKTFAPDYATAKQIFSIAEQYGTKFFSTSALRFASELDGWEGSRAIVTLGGGSNIDEYVIHQVEMAVKTIEEKALRVRVEKQGSQYVCTVVFANDKRATIIYAPSLSFMAGVDSGDSRGAKFLQIQSDYFKSLIADILRFYQTGTVSFDVNQTLEVMKIREAIIKGKNLSGEWIEL